MAMTKAKYERFRQGFLSGAVKPRVIYTNGEWTSKTQVPWDCIPPLTEILRALNQGNQNPMYALKYY